MTPAEFPASSPRFIRRLLRYFLRHEDGAGREAEFEEFVSSIAADKSLKSHRRAIWAPLLFSFPGLLKNFIFWEAAMLKNYLTIAWRNILKHKGLSFINITGLALGMSCSLLIFVWVDKQMSYDRAQPNKGRIVRLEEEEWANLPTSYRKVLDTIPEIEKYVQVSSWEKPTLRSGDNLFDAEKLVFADHTVFDIFHFSFIHGNPETALRDPYSLVLCRSEALRLFGSENPMGQNVLYENKFPFTVTAIVEDNDDFHLEYRALAPFTSLPILKGRPKFLDENNDNFLTYLLLRPQTDVAALKEKLTEALNAIRTRPAVFSLRPFSEIYFTRDIKYEKGVIHGNFPLVVLFSAVAVLILLIACVNFINLVTARSSSRAKEISVRKATGAIRKNLVVQFLGETSLTTFVALILALGAVAVLLPPFANLTGEILRIDWTSGKWLAGVGGVFCFTALAAGIFPAFYLSSLDPVALMRGRSEKPVRQAPFRTVLTIFQFSVAIFLIIGAVSVLRQLDFMKNQDMGFDGEQILLVPLKGDLKESPSVLQARLQEGKMFGERKAVFKRRLLQSSDIRGVTFTGQVPGILTNTNTWTVHGEPKPMVIMQTDPDFLDVMGLELIEGRNISWDVVSDLGLSYIINEAAVPFLGLDPPVAQTVRANFGESRIVGVVKNFHFRSLHKSIEPMAILWFDGWADNAVIKISGGDVRGTIAHIRKTWSEVCPDAPFSYTFLDETVGRLYAAESRLGRILEAFVVLAVLLSCLGLLGLSAYVAEQRTKEIGIRKVLGARESEIVVLLSRDFFKWALLANIFAWPAAFLATEKWLQGFAYRAAFHLGPFLLAMASALVLALWTVGYQALKAARCSPVAAIRFE